MEALRLIISDTTGGLSNAPSGLLEMAAERSLGSSDGSADVAFLCVGESGQAADVRIKHTPAEDRGRRTRQPCWHANTGLRFNASPDSREREK